MQPEGESEAADALNESPLPGPQKIGRFEIVRVLGRGGQGLMLLAHDPVLARHVALKVPWSETLITPKLRRRFLREAQAVARLTHPHIVAVYEVGEVGPICYIASAFVAGESLSAWLARHGGPIDPREAAGIVADLADAMDYARKQGVLHRDLKPGNVLLEPVAEGTTSGNGLQASGIPKITDFGLAKILDLVGDETRSGTLVGTPAYMSPEQAKAEHGAIGPATDIYGLGAILYELLAGQPPFQGRSDAETLRQVAYEQPVPPRCVTANCLLDLEAICLKCLEKSPARRYATAGALAADLRRFLAGEATQARPLSRVQHAARWIGQHRAVGAMLATIGLLFVGVSTVSTIAALRVNQARREAENNLARADAKTADNEFLVYVSRLRIAADAIKRGDHGEARRQLMAAYGQDGKICGFDWRYLWAEAAGPHWLDAPGPDGKPQRMYHVRFTPDGRWLVGGQASGKVFVWDAHSRQLVREIQAHSECANTFSFTPDGRIMASASCDKTVKLWDTTTWQQIEAALEHPNKVHCCCFSSDGRLLATGSADLNTPPDHSDDFFIWDVETKRLIVRLPAQPRGLMNMVYSEPLGQFLAVNARGAIERCDVSGDAPRLLQPLEADVSADERNISNIAISPDGLTAAVGRHATSRVDLWDLTTEQVAKSHVGVGVGGGGISFMPDGKRLLLCEGGWREGRTIVWNWLTQHIERSWYRSGAPTVSLVTSPDGKLLASSDAAGSVWLAQIGPVAAWPCRSLAVNESFGIDLNYCEEQNLLCGTSHSTQQLAFWDATTGEPVETGAPIDLPAVFPTVSPDGGRVYVHDSPGRCGWLADLPHGERVARTAMTPAYVRPVFSPDGRLLVGCDDNFVLHIVDAKTGETLHKVEKAVFPSEQPTALAFRNDGAAFVGAHASGCRLVDLRDTRVQDFGSGATFARFSPDDQLVLKLGEPNQCGLFDVATGELRTSLQDCAGHADAGDFTPDGKIVVVGQQGRLDLYRVSDGAHILELPSYGDHRSAASCQFSKDGQRLLVIWDRGSESAVVQEFRAPLKPSFD